jgi:hypothetical protein
MTKKEWQQCGSKFRFKTAHKAQWALGELVRKGKAAQGSLHVYGCTFCHGFHVGHNARSWERAREWQTASQST